MPLGPLPMVLQNPLPHQGMVETQPLSPPTPVSLAAAPPAEAGVHHLIMLLSEVNLQTQHNQYGSVIETVDPLVLFTSNTSDMTLHLPRPPTDGAIRVPWFPIRRIKSNATT